MTAKTLNNNCPSVQQVGAEEAPHCVDNVWHYGPKYFFVAPRATPKPSLLPESTLVGFPLDCGAQAPSGGGRPDGALRSRVGRSAAHTTYVGAGGAPASFPVKAQCSGSSGFFEESLHMVSSHIQMRPLIGRRP